MGAVRLFDIALLGVLHLYTYYSTYYNIRNRS